MRECGGSLRHVRNGAVGVLKIDAALLVGPEFIGKHSHQSRGILAHETTLEIVVPRIHRWRIEPRLDGEVARRSYGVPDRFAEALQRLEHLGTALGISRVDSIELGPGTAIVIVAKAQIDAEFSRRVGNELSIELDDILDVCLGKVDVATKNCRIERMETIFK